MTPFQLKRPEPPKPTPAARVSKQIRTAGQAGMVSDVASAASAGGSVWRVKASAEESASGDGWTELSSNGNGAAAAGLTQSPNCTGSSVSGCDFATLGQAFPHGTMLKITSTTTNQSGTFPLTDVGNGSSFGPAIGLTPAVQSALGWNGEDVLIQMADGSDLAVAGGFGTLVSGTAGTGTGTTGSTTTTTTTVEPYEFTRGSQGSPENSWDCMSRLAQEVDWSRWAELNTLIYASDNELRAGKPSLIVDGGEDWLRTFPQYAWSPNRAIAQVTLDVFADRWGVQVGAVIKLDTGTSIDGIYLVTETHGYMVNPELQVVLSRPIEKLAEPAPTTTTTTTTTPRAGGGTSGTGTSSGWQSFPTTIDASKLGGYPQPNSRVAQMANCILAQFSQLHVSSTIRAGTDAGTCSHADGNAVDISDGTGGSTYMDNAAQWVSDNFSSVLCQGIHQGIHGEVILSCSGGQNVPASYWGQSTWDEHVNHIHISMTP